MKTAIALLCAAAVLSGCETTPINELSYKQVQAVAGKIAATCAPYKAQGKRTYQGCIDQEINREIATRERNRQRMQDVAQGLAKGMKNMSDAYGQQAQAYAARNRYCNTTFYGNMASTNCF